MSAKAEKKTGTKRKKANGYQMPGHIPKGEVLKDTMKNEWVIDTSIGIGGFGEIYSAHKSSDRQHNNFVVKIEPSENGPLFCERTVYCRIGKKEDIEEFMKLRKLKTLGMPQFYGFGTHELGGIKYRFLVMERYGRDLWSLFLENGKVFPTSTVLKVGIQIIDVLEYLHVKSYVHADIKGANLLLGIKKGLENQVFLVDFGLASRYLNEYKPNPKKAHNGTIEYTSRDAHLGVTTRRGDVEILGFNMLHWLSSKLPWEKLKDPASVQKEKIKYMNDCNLLLRTCFTDKEPCDELKKYFQHISKMEPLEEPNYNTLRTVLATGIKKSDNKLEFKVQKSPLNEMPRSAKNRKLDDETPKKEVKPRAAKATTSKKDENKDSPKKKKVVKKTETEVKRSWKDFPTIANGAKPPTSDEVPAKIVKKR